MTYDPIDISTKGHSPSPDGSVHKAEDRDGPRPADSRTSQLTIILPTKNERDNVAPLLDRLGHALRGSRFEVVFVDDSDDGTAEEAECDDVPGFVRERRRGPSMSQIAWALPKHQRIVSLQPEAEAQGAVANDATPTTDDDVPGFVRERRRGPSMSQIAWALST